MQPIPRLMTLALSALLFCSFCSIAFAQEEPLYPIFDPGSKTWGFMDRQGQVVIEPVFVFVNPFAEEYALAEASFPYSGLSYYCVIDREGHLAAGPVVMDTMRGFNGWFDVYDDHILLGDYIFQLADGSLRRLNYLLDAPLADENAPAPIPFSEGLKVAEITLDDGSLRFGYRDENGEMVISPRFTVADDFSGGLALVVEDGNYCYIDREGTTVWSSEWLRSNSGNPTEGASEPSCAVWEDLLQGKLDGFTLGETMVQLQESGRPLRVYPDGIGPVDSSLRLEFAWYEPTGDDRIEYITATDFDIGGICPGMNAAQVERLIGAAAFPLQSGVLFYEGVSLPDQGGTVCIEFHFDESGLLAELELYLGW